MWWQFSIQVGQQLKGKGLRKTNRVALHPKRNPTSTNKQQKQQKQQQQQQQQQHVSVIFMHAKMGKYNITDWCQTQLGEREIETHVHTHKLWHNLEPQPLSLTLPSIPSVAPVCRLVCVCVNEHACPTRTPYTYLLPWPQGRTS